MIDSGNSAAKIPHFRPTIAGPAQFNPLLNRESDMTEDGCSQRGAASDKQGHGRLMRREVKKSGMRKASRDSLPLALATGMATLSLGDTFFETAWRAAKQAGCELLFEMPGLIFGKKDGRAAAIRCSEQDEGEMFFLVFCSSSGEISVIEEQDAPQRVIDFTRSYAGVLGMLGRDSRITSPLLQ